MLAKSGILDFGILNSAQGIKQRNFTTNLIVKQAVSEIHEEGDEVWGGSFNR